MLITDQREIDKYLRDPRPYRQKAVEEYFEAGAVRIAPSRRALLALFGLGALATSIPLNPALAANRTAWTAGNGPGLTWTAAFNTTDFTTSDSSSLLANTHTVLSSVAGFANGTNLDQLMDIDLRLSISSSTIAAGANFTFWLYYLLDDGSTYGDGQLTAGTAASKTPAFAPCAAINLYAAASQTSLVGIYTGIPLRPGTFKLAIQNNSGFTLTNSATVCDIMTYNINLNN